MTSPNHDAPPGAVAMTPEDLASLLAAYGIVTEADSGLPPLAPDPTTPDKPPPVHIRAARGSQLEQLYDQFTELKPALDKLAEQVEEIKGAIKRSVRELAPEAEEFWITRSDGLGRPIKVARRVTDKFDSKGFERNNGDTYAAWKKPVESWALGWA
jgi:hypothetical protein